MKLLLTKNDTSIELFVNILNYVTLLSNAGYIFFSN